MQKGLAPVQPRLVNPEASATLCARAKVPCRLPRTINSCPHVFAPICHLEDTQQLS